MQTLISVLKLQEVAQRELFPQNIKSLWVLNRPPTLLAKEQIKEIKKNLKKYSIKFNQKDAQR